MLPIHVEKKIVGKKKQTKKNIIATMISLLSVYLVLHSTTSIELFFDVLSFDSFHYFV